MDTIHIIFVIWQKLNKNSLNNELKNIRIVKCNKFNQWFIQQNILTLQTQYKCTKNKINFVNCTNLSAIDELFDNKCIYVQRPNVWQSSAYLNKCGVFKQKKTSRV